MYRYAIKAFVVVAMALPMMSCPSGAVAIVLDVWVFTVSTTGGGNDVAGLSLLPGGQTATPNPMPAGATDEFSGTLTWTQTGSTFSMSQVIGVNNEIGYTGTVQSSTSMSGTWSRTAGGVGSGTWSAMLAQ